MLFFNHCLEGLYVDELTTFLACSEEYSTVDEGEEGVVFTHTYIQSRVVLSATLTLDDVAGLAFAAAEDLYTKSFAF